MKFLLEIITPQREAFSEEVDRIIVPTTSGIVGVMAHHEPLFTALTEGEIKITSERKEYYLAIGGGFMEVNANKVTILVSRAVHAHELNEAEIQRAQEAAKTAISRKAQGEELAQAQSMLRRSFVELKVFKRHRKRINTNVPMDPSA
jgi:F-type H+-transporting ATPase subunit epsilon